MRVIALNGLDRNAGIICSRHLKQGSTDALLFVGSAPRIVVTSLAILLAKALSPRDPHPRLSGRRTSTAPPHTLGRETVDGHLPCWLGFPGWLD